MQAQQTERQIQINKLNKHAQKKVPYIFEQNNAEMEATLQQRTFPGRPSNLFLKMYTDMMKCVQNNPTSNVASPEVLATSGTCPISINTKYDTLFQYYRDVIVRADHEIMISAGFWKNSTANKIVSDAFRELNQRLRERGDGHKVVVKIMWGRVTPTNPKYRSHAKMMDAIKLNIPSPVDCPHLDFEVLNTHKWLLGVFHVKYMVVDRKIVLLTSANIQDKANIEFVSHMEGRVVDSFYDLFLRQWGVPFNVPLPLANSVAPPQSGYDVRATPVRGPCVYHTPHEEVPMFLANRPPGSNLLRHKWENPQNVTWLSGINQAQRKLFIQTPDFNARLPFNAVVAACCRDVEVTIEISWIYNAPKERFFQGGTNHYVMKKMYKKLLKLGYAKNLTVCFFVSNDQTVPTKKHNNHTKFMAIDDQVAIYGSGNMDTQSWHHSQEVNIVVDSPLLVKEWLELFRLSQNTHLYGMINPQSGENPLVQMKRLLAKERTQPSPPPAGFDASILNIDHVANPATEVPSSNSFLASRVTLVSSHGMVLADRSNTLNAANVDPTIPVLDTNAPSSSSTVLPNNGLATNSASSSSVPLSSGLSSSSSSVPIAPSLASSGGLAPSTLSASGSYVPPASNIMRVSSSGTPIQPISFSPARGLNSSGSYAPLAPLADVSVPPGMYRSTSGSHIPLSLNSSAGIPNPMSVIGPSPATLAPPPVAPVLGSSGSSVASSNLSTRGSSPGSISSSMYGPASPAMEEDGSYALVRTHLQNFGIKPADVNAPVVPQSNLSTTGTGGF